MADQPVQSGRQRIAERRRDLELRGLPARKLESPVALHDQPGRDDGLGQLFHEERHAVGAPNDLIDDARRQRLASGDPERDRHDLLRESRVRAIMEIWPCIAQVGTNSGRNVSTTRTGNSAIRSSSMPNSSRVDASTQCRSSTTITKRMPVSRRHAPSR